MKKSNEITPTLISDEKIVNCIYHIRGKKVMMDRDLAGLYGVETGHLNRQVKRNIERFPDDFMFKLDKDELENLRCQIGISSWGGSRYNPMVFTEQGVSMLSSVLNSKQAIAVNIQIIRIFTRFREILITHKDILLKLEKMEKKLLSHDESIEKYNEQTQLIFRTLKKLMGGDVLPRKKIGYKRSDETDK